jgi:cytochrome c oxidase assembly protein subunit 15
MEPVSMGLMNTRNIPARGADKRGILLVCAALAVALVMVVVILGAFTRLKDAGLGCPDWPGCYGHLTWPSSASEVAAAEARFPETPVEHDKTWPEMVHRYFASTLGLMILGIAIFAWRWRTRSSLPLKLPIFLVLLVMVQGAFGMWTVTLKLWPQVVTAHLLGGFATASCLWLLVLRLSPWRPLPQVPPALKKMGFAGLLLVIAQIALGGWTSSNYAAIACPDLPTCHGVWWPPADYVQGFNIFQHVGPNYLGGLLDNHARTAIHFAHRLGAFTVTLVLLILAVGLWRLGRPGRILAAILILALAVQVSLGISNVHWALPLPVAVAHNAFGLILLLVLISINYALYMPSKGEKKHV